MDVKTSEVLCLLCFRFKIEVKDLEVTKKIEKYLQIKMECITTGVCANCFKSLEEFHEFYEKVHLAQENFKKKDIFLRHEAKSKEECKITEETICTEETERGTLSNGKSEINNIYFKEKEEEKVQDLSITKPSKFLIDKKTTSSKNDNSEKTELKSDKNLKHSKLKEISGEIEKKMLEFYNIKCEKCDYGKFTSFKMLSKHYINVHNTQGYIKCCKRNIRVNDKYYLRSHMFKHLQPETCRCAVCGKDLSSLATLKHHMILHKPTEERPFQCNVCNKGFCCKNDLKNHEKAIHLPESKRQDYICDVCGKVFQKVANLRYHHSTVHLQERKYVCEICAKCFTTQSGLRTHTNAAHSTLDPIQCHECNKWLKTKDTFQKHLQLHQNNSYPCTYCNKICNSSASLRSHLVKHSEERPYSCVICRKSFKTKTHLKNHSTQHIGGSHYMCPYCSKLFVNMSNYYTHRKRMHSSEKLNKLPDKPKAQEIYRTAEQNNVEENSEMYNYKMLTNDEENCNNELPPEVSRQNIIVSPVTY